MHSAQALKLTELITEEGSDRTKLHCVTVEIVSVDGTRKIVQKAYAIRLL